MENNVTECIKVEPVEAKKEMDVKLTTAPVKEKRNGKEEKSRKKDDKSIEQILKSLSNLETPEEKLTTMCKKYLEVLDENRKYQAALKVSEKKVLMIQREKEQCQSEKSKAVLARSRLESLCRELQRQNKAVKEESLLRLREEEEKRKEISTQFQSTLAEITTLMDETNDKNAKLHEDNIEIHKKFKSVFDEMDIREQHFEELNQIMKHKLQVTEAKQAKVTLEMTEERESLKEEKNQLLLKLTEYKTRIRDLQTVEANLRSQINMYTDKYDEFQTALTKSNEVFGGFNEDMEKMSKKILKLEKETSLWKLRCEKGQAALLEMATDKQARDNEIVVLNRRFSLLQELCKAFQKERATLLAQLKEKSNNGNVGENEQVVTEDNQNLNGNVESVKDSTLNGLAIIDNINAKINEQTKEIKTDISTINETNTDFQNLKVQETLTNVCEENVENINNKTVNNENIRLIDTAPVSTEESQPSIKNSNETIIQDNVSESIKEEQIVQVPNETTGLPQTDTILNSDPVIKSTDLVEPSPTLVETTKEETLSPPVIHTAPDIIQCSESKVNEKLGINLQEPVSDIKDAPKVDSYIENSNTTVPNAGTQNNPVTHKKHKEGKKKRK